MMDRIMLDKAIKGTLITILALSRVNIRFMFTMLILRQLLTRSLKSLEIAGKS